MQQKQHFRHNFISYFDRQKLRRESVNTQTFNRLLGTGQVTQVNVLVKDDGKLLRKQLVKADAIMSIDPAFTCPAVALGSAVSTREERGK